MFPARDLRALPVGALVGLCAACSGSSTPGGPTAPPAAPTVLIGAVSLGSFEGMEEPAVVYHPSRGTFDADGYVNITNPSRGLFRFVLRFRPAEDWWDGDRATTNTDRQRAEVKGLGARQGNGETFEYAMTWRASRGGSGRFWHVFQLKATDGDEDEPLVVNSIRSGNTAAVRYWPGNADNFIVVRTYAFAPDEWTTVRIRIRTSTRSDGEVRASVNGDPFTGLTGVAVYRPGSTDYRPKWGSYRGVAPTEPYADDVVEHMNVFAGRVSP